MDYFINGFITGIKLLITCDQATYSAVFVTLKASTSSIILSLIIGIPAGFLLGYRSFPGKKQIRAVVDTLLALPTVVVGLMVYAFISRKGLLGGFGLLFTVPGIVIAQVLLVLPIVVSLTATAIESIDARLKNTLKTLGAKGGQIAWTSLSEAKYSVLAAAATAYGRVISEVGVSMMIGGNIKWHTRTITTTIALETGKGEFAMGIALGLVLLALAFTVNMLLIILKKRAQ